MWALDQSSYSQLVFQGAPELSRDVPGVGGYVKGEVKGVG